MKRLCLATAILASSSLSFLYAQQPVVVDWSTKSLGQHPSVVDRSTDVMIRVEGVNDVHFTYSINISSTPQVHPDGDVLLGAITAAGHSSTESASCTDLKKDLATSVTEVQASIDNFYKMPETLSKECSVTAPCNVTIDQARDGWAKGSATRKASTDKFADFKQLCSTSAFDEINAQIDRYTQQLHALDVKLASSDHVVTKAAVLLPDNDYTLVIVQKYVGIPTKDGTATLQLSPTNNRLNLSVGVLFSEIQNRAYTSVAAPNSTGTQNVLAVAGVSSFNPTAVALLNYQIPRADWDTIGFTLSSGPVFRLGTKSDVSSFGYFGGVGVHLFHRLFITPGVTLGEFADFPPGFSQAGQAVPAGLGTLTPVKRWTTRFGFSISYKVKDFSSFGLGGSVKAGTAVKDAATKPIVNPPASK